MTLPPLTRLQAPESVIHRTFDDGESVLLHLETEQYFGLNSVGTRMWSVLTQADSVADAFQQLQEEYEVEPDVLRRDLDELIAQLLEHRLLEPYEP